VGQRLKVDWKNSFYNGSFRFGKSASFPNTYFCNLNPRSNVDLVTLLFNVKKILNENPAKKS